MVIYCQAPQWAKVRAVAVANVFATTNRSWKRSLTGDAFENDVTTMATIGDDVDSFSSMDDPKPPGKFHI
jgi:hypothetical protein